MTLTVERSVLVARARQRADQENSSFCTDAEVMDYFESSARALYDLLLKYLGEEYYLTTATLTTTPGSAFVTLPDDFYRLATIRTLNPEGRWQSLDPFMRTDVDRWKNAALGGPNRLEVYRIRTNPAHYVLQDGVNIYVDEADELEVYPVLNSIATIEIDYVPIMQTLVTTDSTNEVLYPSIHGWEEWVVLDVAIKMMTKEESDASLLIAERDRLERRISEHAPSRDRGRPERVVDVVRDTYDADDWPRVQRWR